MPASRTFSYDYLKQLILEHPDWSHREYADALTQEVRERTGDPNFTRIRPNTVAAVLNRYRDTWLEQGVRVPTRRKNRVIEWVGIPGGPGQTGRMHTGLRRLRSLQKLQKGIPVSPREEHLALAWQRRLNDSKFVLDLTPRGRPYERAARPDEVDGTGELLSVTARHPGLTDEQWEQMTPEDRRRASARWFEGGVHPEDPGDTRDTRIA